MAGSQCIEAHRCEDIGDLQKCTSGPTSVCTPTDRSTEDAVMMALHTALSHLDQSHTYVKMLLVGFCSTFKASPKNWDNTSSPLALSTGTPQGCVLSPLLFSLFTHDCSPIHPTNTIITFADDATMVGWLGTTMSQPTGTDFFSIKNSSFWWSKPTLQCVHQAFERWFAKTHTPLTG